MKQHLKVSKPSWTVAEGVDIRLGLWSRPRLLCPWKVQLRLMCTIVLQPCTWVVNWDWLSVSQCLRPSRQVWGCSLTHKAIKLGMHKQHSFIKWQWCLHDWAWSQKAQVSCMKKWPKSPWSLLMLYHLLLPSLCIWPQGTFPMTSWQRRKRRRPGLLMVLWNIQAPPQSEQLLTTAS